MRVALPPTSTEDLQIVLTPLAPRADELDTARVARRSVVTTQAIAAGTVLTAGMLACRRPATGIAPRELPGLVGRRVRQAMGPGAVLQWDHIETAPR